MAYPINFEFLRAFKNISKNEVVNNERLRELIQNIKEEMSGHYTLKNLKEKFHQFCHLLSIEEVMKNDLLIDNIIKLERMFEVREA